MKIFRFLMVLSLLLLVTRTSAQVVEGIDTTVQQSDDMKLDKITNLRWQLEKANRSYSTPVVLDRRLERLEMKDGSSLSPVARYILNWRRAPSDYFGPNVTFRDTVICNPLFLPLVFKGGLVPNDIKLPEMPTALQTEKSLIEISDTLFSGVKRNQQIQNGVYNYMRFKHPDYFQYSLRDLPDNPIKLKVIKDTKPQRVAVENEANANDVAAPKKFIPERRYWTSTFESSLQFAQNYISSNWSKGGNSNMNIANREYFTYTYNKDRIKFANQFELNDHVYTATGDSLRNYKIGNDVMRCTSNIGYQAFSKWYYTFDATVQTQLFDNYTANTNTKVAAFLAPLYVNIGLGMKYSLDKSYPKYNKYRKIALSVNIAPLSYSYRHSILSKNFDLARYGFPKNSEGKYKQTLQTFGSTINSSMTFQLSRNTSWYSRFYYTTSYKRIESEFENRLTTALSRFFSTTLTLNLRYDDGVAKNDDWKYLQVNELISFGFNYKW